MAKGYSARGGFSGGGSNMMRQQQQMQQKLMKMQQEMDGKQPGKPHPLCQLGYVHEPAKRAEYPSRASVQPGFVRKALS